ncbi:S41 family peptidase [Flavihumibacter rivuli]|uniref:S41 family peptidase n=1 Tax=Flavihumibacter rivuli TaxID=2838156 RepID=UPI001BDE76C6|nr:S41 family peptidase [Flavihumibacter rivuli]ULQ57513.1 S41 family peptidase [Flavihumibacter rivuli]
MKRFFVHLALIALVFTACKKESDNPGGGNTGGGGTTVTEADKIKDTTLLYTRDIYLWYNQIPGSFNPRSYADPNAIMEAIRTYSNEPGFTGPVDRWSFAVKQAEWDNISGGIAGDKGLGIFFRTSDDLRVSYVEKDGPAGKAGVERSWRITRINGNSNINTTDASINFIVNAIYGSSPATVNFTKPDGTTTEITLTNTTYKEKPIILDTVYTINGKKTGYFVLNSFLGDQTEIAAGFEQSFAKFATAGVTEMVVDLRYNGGGYVALQELLANYLAPASADGKVMYRETFNDKYSQYNETVNFAKKGAVNPTRIFFIISQNTASASEAVINVMKPVTDVKVIGPRNSNGKPVGYFPIPIGDWYIFPVSIRIVNQLNQGSYFNGFTPDSRVPDGLDKKWGDITEDCLGSAVKYIGTGSFRAVPADRDAEFKERLAAYEKMKVHKVQALVEDRSGFIPR